MRVILALCAGARSQLVGVAFIGRFPMPVAVSEAGGRFSFCQTRDSGSVGIPRYLSWLGRRVRRAPRIEISPQKGHVAIWAWLFGAPGVFPLVTALSLLCLYKERGEMRALSGLSEVLSFVCLLELFMALLPWRLGVWGTSIFFERCFPPDSWGDYGVTRGQSAFRGRILEITWRAHRGAMEVTRRAHTYASGVPSMIRRKTCSEGDSREPLMACVSFASPHVSRAWVPLLGGLASPNERAMGLVAGYEVPRPGRGGAAHTRFGRVRQLPQMAEPVGGPVAGSRPAQSF